VTFVNITHKLHILEQNSYFAYAPKLGNEYLVATVEAAKNVHKDTDNFFVNGRLVKQPPD
jgi:hypothetical protein